jgi:adenylate cyclase
MDVVSYFNEGIRHYRAARFPNAVAQFENALLAHPKDKLSASYIERCQYLMANPPVEDWNGVWVMTHK